MYEIKHLSKKEFPSQLLEIPQPPKRLSLAGTLPPSDSFFLCVVGSRKYTSYGKEVCRSIIQDLAGSPVVIVSGLALGIDAIAHQAALEANLPTLAFPGSGLAPSVLYPRTNKLLAERIIKSGGGLLSEFEDDMTATTYTFPQRNRLMAGLSHGILIIEAENKSGTLITARLGTEYNKDVFAIPSPIFSKTSVGPNNLIKAGAIPVTSGEDILNEWGIATTEIDPKQLSLLLEECSEEEKQILDILREPLEKEELLKRSGMSIIEMNILLSTMEIKGLTQEAMGKIRNNIF